MTIKNVLLSETLGDFVTDFNGLSSDVGDLTLLTTSAKNNIVAAINELVTLSDSAAIQSISRASVSVTDAGGDGSLTYSSATGVITYTGPSASEVRSKISVTDAGGDGSLSYDNSTGVLTYTGPSATEVRAHLSAGARLSYSSGQFNVANAGIDSAALGSLSVSTAKIQNDGVTYAKIQNVATANRVLGSTTAGGAVSEVQVTSSMLSSAVTLIIYNSAGTALKTLYGAGA